MQPGLVSQPLYDSSGMEEPGHERRLSASPAREVTRGSLSQELGEPCLVLDLLIEDGDIGIEADADYASLTDIMPVPRFLSSQKTSSFFTFP
jgi:hypothetical protein